MAAIGGIPLLVGLLWALGEGVGQRAQGSVLAELLTHEWKMRVRPREPKATRQVGTVTLHDGRDKR